MSATDSLRVPLRARLAQPQVRGWTMLIISNIIFAGAYVAGKLALTTMSPVMLNSLRFMLASVILLPIVVRQRAQLRMNRTDLLTFVAVALLGFVLNKYFEYEGVRLSTASDSALLIAGEGIMTALLAWIVLRERATWRHGLALLLGFFGAYLIVERGVLPHFVAGGGSTRIFGDALFLLALLFEAMASIISKRLAGRFSPLLVTAATVVGSLAVWVPAGAWQIAHIGLHLTFVSAGAVIYQAVFVTAIGYFFWFGGLQLVAGASAAASLFIQPLIGTLLALILLGEQLSLFTLLGGLCIIVSVWFVSRGGSRPNVSVVTEMPPQ